MNSKRNVIFDFGSNNGDDIPYYLKKAELVVAVEANSSLCKQIEERFSYEIATGRLFIENCVLTTDEEASEVYFYMHKTNHVLSQFPQPSNTEIENFEKVLLPSKSALSIIKKYAKYGAPYYIKIDIEHYDEAILRDLFKNGIRPSYISAESHSIVVFSLLVTLGGYKSFKLVDGQSVAKKYKSHRIISNGKSEVYSFPFHSAGPFGDDIDGEWMTATNFFRLLAFENLGWKDIHATDQAMPNPLVAPQLTDYMIKAVKRKCRTKMHLFAPNIVKRWVKRHKSQ